MVSAGAYPQADARRRDVAAMARGGALSTAGIVVNAVTSFPFSIVLARSPGASGTSSAGTFFVALAISTVFETVAQFGADTGAMRMVSRYRGLGKIKDTPTVIRAGQVPVLALSTVLPVLLVLFAPEVTRIITDDDRDQMATDLVILALALPLAAGVSVVLGATRGFGNTLPYELIGRVGRSILVLIAVVLGLGSDGSMISSRPPRAAALRPPPPRGAGAVQSFLRADIDSPRRASGPSRGLAQAAACGSG